MYVGIEDDELKQKGGFNAAYELERQPELWEQSYRIVEEHRDEIRAFLAPLAARENASLLLVGAGSSGLAARCVERHVREHSGFCNVQSVRSTELILDFDRYLSPHDPVVMCTFGSSGSTPEVVDCVRHARSVVEDFHLIIVNCTDDGIIIQENAGREDTLYVPLPADTKGKSFAATAEFTVLVFQAMLMFDIDNLERYETLASYLQSEARRLFSSTFLEEVVSDETVAMTCMGSLEMEHLAAEAALKAVEFSGGTYLSNYTSSLEFRHGPKLIMSSPVIALCLIYPQKEVARYDLDMMSEIAGDDNKGLVTCLTYSSLRKTDVAPAHLWQFETHEILEQVPVAGIFLYALVFQSLALLTAIKHGVKADWPSTDEFVPKVANRVTVYDGVVGA